MISFDFDNSIIIDNGLLRFIRLSNLVIHIFLGICFAFQYAFGEPINCDVRPFTDALQTVFNTYCYPFAKILSHHGATNGREVSF